MTAGVIASFAQAGVVLAGLSLGEAMKADPQCRQFEDRCSICRVEDGVPACSTPAIACVKGDWTCTQGETADAAAAPGADEAILEQANQAAEDGDYPRAFELLSPLAAAGNATAQNDLGWLYDNGYGVAQDPAKAFELFGRAADGGDRVAAVNMAVMLREGRGVERDLEKSVEVLRSVADDYIDAKMQLAYAYLDGLGTPADPPKAFALMREAAETGDPRAQNDLGWMYEKGRGVATDDEEAIRWYRLAAAQGYPLAQENVEWMYRSGRAVPDDPAEVLRWFRRREFR